MADNTELIKALKPGFYWVRLRADYPLEPAAWNGKEWIVMGIERGGQPSSDEVFRAVAVEIGAPIVAALEGSAPPAPSTGELAALREYQRATNESLGLPPDAGYAHAVNAVIGLNKRIEVYEKDLGMRYEAIHGGAAPLAVSLTPTDEEIDSEAETVSRGYDIGPHYGQDVLEEGVKIGFKAGAKWMRSRLTDKQKV